MPDPHTFHTVMEAAEQAASSGDSPRAESLLREALRLQHADLGPTHPDLASTLNNLAVVCESNGKLDDAEAFYRHAYAVASSSRPAGDPLVITSRNNLRDFCAARSRSFEDWPGIAEPEPSTDRIALAQAMIAANATPVGVPLTPRPATPAPGLTTGPETRPVPAPALQRPATPATTAQAPAVAAPSPTAEAERPWPPADVTTPLPSPPPPTPLASRSWPLGLLAAVAVAVAIAAALLLRSSGENRLTRDTTASTTPAAPAVVPPAAVLAPGPGGAAPALPGGGAASAGDRAVAPTPPAADVATTQPAPARTADPAPAPATTPTPTDAVRVVTASVCADLSAGGDWRCTPLATPGAPGRASFFTRIASPQPLRVEHRWYQGDQLRQRVVLSIAANPADGFRTYSRQTLTPGAWRVELRTSDGPLLHESRFDVQ